MINPAEIPTLEHVDAEAVITAGKKIRQAGDGIRDAGADVYKAWQGLAHCYEAPEAATLLSAMAPVRAKTATFDTKAGKTAAALVTYGITVGPIKKRLVALKAAATAFVARMKALGEEWRADPANVEEDRRLQREVNKAVQAFREAEEEAAKAINAASRAAAPAPRPALKPGQATPWGTPEQVDVPWYQDIWNAVAGFGGGFAVEGAGGAITGLAAMVGLGEEGDFARAMLGLGDLGALLTPGLATMPDVGHLAIGDAAKGVPTSRNERLKMMGKGFLAWDKWKTDPARAAGEAAFNVITLPFIGTKIGTAGKLGGLAAATNKATAVAARVSSIADVPSHIIRLGAKGTGAAIKGIANLGDLGRVGKIPGLGDVGKVDVSTDASKPNLSQPDTPQTKQAPAEGDAAAKSDAGSKPPPTVAEVSRMVDEIGRHLEGDFAARDPNRLTLPDDLALRHGDQQQIGVGGRREGEFVIRNSGAESPGSSGGVIDDPPAHSKPEADPGPSGGPDASPPSRTGPEPTPRSPLRFDTTGSDTPPKAGPAESRGGLKGDSFHRERFRGQRGPVEPDPDARDAASNDNIINSGHPDHDANPGQLGDDSSRLGGHEDLLGGDGSGPPPPRGPGGTGGPEGFDPGWRHRIRDILAEHPDVAAVITRLTEDQAHPLNVTDAIKDPARSAATLEAIKELAEGRLLRGRTLEEFLQVHPGRGPLFEPVAPEINAFADGINRKNTFVAKAKEVDPVRTIGDDANEMDLARVNEYGRRLRDEVQPLVQAEIAELASRFDDVEVSLRTKRGEGILEKVQRMTVGSENRPPRPGYQVGDVIDAVGARITVSDTKTLGELLESIKKHFGTGDDGRILEIENMYAAPKGASPSYRVIPLTISVEAGGKPYTFELQLTTRRASIAADINHNTRYKPNVELDEVVKTKIDDMFQEAAALDQNEARRSMP